jgi:hypothetical protein
MDDWPAELHDIWENLEHESWSAELREQWQNEAADLFEQGWIEFDEDTSPEELQAIRDSFFELMEEFDVSIEDFDWDAWRDWYESA